MIQLHIQMTKNAVCTFDGLSTKSRTKFIVRLYTISYITLKADNIIQAGFLFKSGTVRNLRHCYRASKNCDGWNETAKIIMRSNFVYVNLQRKLFSWLRRLLRNRLGQDLYLLIVEIVYRWSEKNACCKTFSTPEQ